MRILPFVRSLSFLLALLPAAKSQENFTADAAHFTYDTSAPLDLKELSVRTEPNATLHDITYVSPSGGVVPATLILPTTPGNHPAILWGHWMLPNSPTANRSEFLPEALALAQSGVVSLLIDAPQVRPGYKQLGTSELLQHQVIDLRRGLDLLSTRPDVDPRRIAFVGHSFDSGAGAILDAVDQRPAAFVFMTGPQSVRYMLLNSPAPRMVKIRKTTPLAQLEELLAKIAWADPGTYAAHLGPAPALFQYGTKDDEWVPLADAKNYVGLVSDPKEVKYYEADHALNAQARADRFAFLAQHLAFTPPPPAEIATIPQTR